MTTSNTTKPGAFTPSEWKKIRTLAEKDPARFGLPQRIYGSLVLGSFNIRKLGKLKTKGSQARDDLSFKFLADVCRQFDLLAVQEVMGSTESLEHLVALMGEDYGLIISDATGALPGGGGGMPERMAFIYDRSTVRRTPMVTDVTYDRFEVLETLVKEFDKIRDQVEPYRVALAAYEKKSKAEKKKATKPKLKMPTFLSFVRTPFAVGFQIKGHTGSEPFKFLAVNAHLHYGDSVLDRQREGTALIRWMMGKTRERRENSGNTVLFGDLNLDYNNPEKDLKRIRKMIAAEKKKSRIKVELSFPFLFKHPNSKQEPPVETVFRTNVSLNQTFDQIGIISTNSKLTTDLSTIMGGHANPDVWGTKPEGPDYGVFNFTELFAFALEGKSYAELKKEKKEKAFKSRFDFRISDHLPIWYRYPLPKLQNGVTIGPEK